MKCLVLAAGYATRLYPLTENFPKPLLDVNGKSILTWLLEDLNAISDIDEFIIVSNHKFSAQFEQWVRTFDSDKNITVADDGSTHNENRLGAVRDIAFAIQKFNINDDLMVIAGDNLVDFSFSGFVRFFNEKKATCIMRHYEPETSRLSKTGVALVDDDDRVLRMWEKPARPATNWAVPPFYIYIKNDLSRIVEGATSGQCPVDAPGSFISWLCGQCAVYAYPMPGARYDIGDMKSYTEVKKIYNRSFDNP